MLFMVIIIEQIKQGIDVMVSHDWPKNVILHGDQKFVQQWYNRNQALRADVILSILFHSSFICVIYVIFR